MLVRLFGAIAPVLIVQAALAGSKLPLPPRRPPEVPSAATSPAAPPESPPAAATAGEPSGVRAADLGPARQRAAGLEIEPAESPQALNEHCRTSAAASRILVTPAPPHYQPEARIETTSCLQSCHAGDLLKGTAATASLPDS